MPTVKLHATASDTWRILLDEKVHPSLVGFHNVTDAVFKMKKLEPELGPYDKSSLVEMTTDMLARHRHELLKPGGDRVFINDLTYSIHYVKTNFVVAPGEKK